MELAIECPEAIDNSNIKVDNSSTSRQEELCKKAAYVMSARNYTCDKLMFLQTNLSKEYWLEFLRRHSFEIFTKFFTSTHLSHMCSDIFYQICEVIDKRTNWRLLEYITEQLITNESVCCMRNATDISDAETILLFVWRTTLRVHKEDMVHHTLKIINNLLVTDRYNLIAAMIDDEVFNEHQKCELVGVVVMNIIAKEKFDDILVFVLKLKTEICDSTITKLFTYHNIKLFITHGDCCRHVHNYDRILNKACSTDVEKELFKRQLFFDHHFIVGLVQAVKDKLILIENFQKLLVWMFSECAEHVQEYVHGYLLPENLIRDLYLNHMLATRNGFEQIRGFNLSASQVEDIRASIEANRQPLYDYCALLIKEYDYTSLPNMLACVFTDNDARERFLVDFFKSQTGARALYNLIIEEVYDEQFYCTFRFRSRLRKFVRFRNFWVTSNAVARAIDDVLQLYGHPNAVNFSLELEDEVNLLAQESVRAKRAISDANYRVFVCLFRNYRIVDLIKYVAFTKNMRIPHITFFSYMNALRFGVDVPIVI